MNEILNVRTYVRTQNLEILQTAKVRTIAQTAWYYWNLQELLKYVWEGLQLPCIVLENNIGVSTYVRSYEQTTFDGY